MSSAVIPVDIFDGVIFAGTDKLSMRKRLLLPALFHRDASGQISVQARRKQTQGGE